MAESYLFFASVALFAMGCVALALSILFRLKINKLNSLAKGLEPTVFNKSFVVFDPYSEHKIMHSFLFLLPFLPIFVGLSAGVLVLVIVESGMLLALVLLLLALNLIVVEESPEAYQSSMMLIKAVQSGTKIGTGDFKLFKMTRKLMPKLSNYYLGLSLVLIAFSLTLPYIWSSALWTVAMFIGLIIQSSAAAGAALSWIVAITLFVLATTGIQFLALKVKSRLFTYALD